MLDVLLLLQSLCLPRSTAVLHPFIVVCGMDHFVEVAAQSDMHTVAKNRKHPGAYGFWFARCVWSG